MLLLGRWPLSFTWAGLMAGFSPDTFQLGISLFTSKLQNGVQNATQSVLLHNIWVIISSFLSGSFLPAILISRLEIPAQQMLPALLQKSNRMTCSILGILRILEQKFHQWFSSYKKLTQEDYCFHCNFLSNPNNYLAPISHQHSQYLATTSK